MNTTEQILALIAEHRKVADAATQGPLKVGHDGPSRPIITGKSDMLSINRYEQGRWTTYDNEEHDCEFFAHSRNTMPALLDALEVLVRAVDDVESHFPNLKEVDDEPLARALALLKGEKP